MGSWIVVAVQITLSLITLIAAVIAVQWARAGAREGRAARTLVEALTEALRKGHGYPDPSAAVVTDPREASPPPEALPDPDPAPTMARAALAPQVPGRGLGEATRTRLRLVAPDERPDLDGDARETPEEGPPPASGGRGSTLERVSLDEEELAHIDEMAAQCRLTREEMISVLMRSGFTILEGPRK